MKELTENQKKVIAILYNRGAHGTAEATRRAWENGETYYLDTRNAARKGIMRKFNQGNREATEEKRS